MSDREPPIYTLHPLYRLRRLLIINSTIGFLLSLLVTVAPPLPYVQPVWPLSTFIMLASAGLSVLDLAIFQLKKRETEGEESQCTATVKAICHSCHLPVIQLCCTHSHRVQLERSHKRSNEQYEPTIWPVKWIMILDFLIFLALSWVWFAEMYCISEWEYRWGGALIVETYVTILVLFGIILHFRCWWKAYRARERQRWSREAVTATTEAGDNASNHQPARCRAQHQPVCCHPTAQTRCPLDGSQHHSRDGNDAVLISNSQRIESIMHTTPEITGQEDECERGRERSPLLNRKTHIVSRHPTGSTSGHAYLCYSCYHYMYKDDKRAQYVKNSAHKNPANIHDDDHVNVNPTSEDPLCSADSADLVILETPSTPGEAREIEAFG